ncbi:MAG: protein kinase [Planctomycetota bacterium]
MSAVSINDFVELLKKSDVVEAPKLDDLTASASGYDSSKRFARSLVDDGTLTEWQAKFILSGRHRLRIGNYVLLARIRRDEFGDRFLAVHQSLQRKVELLVFSKNVSSDKPRRKALLKKASLVSKLDHPALVHVYDIDHEAERYYLVVEHINGKMVEVAESAGFDETTIAGMIKQCVSALLYAHQNDVVHGSIVPADLIVHQGESIKIQNLSMEPLRRSNSTEHQPTESDDFIAISNIGLKLLKANTPLEPHENRKSLKEIFARLRKNPEVVAGELDAWIEANPKRVISDAPHVTPIESPSKSKSGAHRLRKGNSGKHETAEVEEPQASFWQQQFAENPIKLVASILVPIFLVGLFLAVYVYQQYRPLADNEARVSINAGNQGGVNAQSPESPTNEQKLTAADVDDPGEIKNLIANRVSEDESLKSRQKKNKAAAKSSPKGQATKPKKNGEGSQNKPVAPTPADDNSPPTAPANTADQAIGNGNMAQVQSINVVVNPSPTATPIAAAPSVAQPIDPEDIKIPKAAKKEPDELGKMISGVGEKTETQFKRLGITTFGQLAQLKPGELLAVCKLHGIYMPEDRANSIVKQAKLLNKSPTGTTTSAVKANAGKPAVPTLEHPFAGFPKRFNLPPLTKRALVKISPLKIKNTFLLGLDLICPEGVARSRLIFESKREDEGKTQQWIIGVKKTPKQKPVPIAKFVRTDSEIQFQWLEKADKNKNAEYLRNCFVKLHTPDGEAAVLSLRKPVKIPSLRLDEKSLQAELSFSVNHLPSPDRVRVEVNPIPDGDAEIEMFVPRADSESNALIYFRKLRDQENDKMWFEVGADIRPKMKVTAGTKIVFPGRQPVLVKDIGDLKNLQSQLRAKLTVAVNRLNQKPRDTTLKSEKSQAEFESKAMNAYMKGVNQLLKVPVNLRVIADFDGYQVVMAVSDPELSVDEFKKKQRKSYTSRSSNPQPTETGTPKTPAETKK